MDKNIIIDNRIVHDKTFALRLKTFLENTYPSSLSSLDEKNYLLKVAKDLLHYQVCTLTDKDEKDYLMRCGVIRPKRTINDFKSELSNQPFNTPLQVIHKKTGNKYEVLGIITNSTNAVDGQQMVIYRDKYNKYCREINEFINKFEW